VYVQNRAELSHVLRLELI